VVLLPDSVFEALFSVDSFELFSGLFVTVVSPFRVVPVDEP
jgi:hypothetical protein